MRTFLCVVLLSIAAVAADPWVEGKITEVSRLQLNSPVVGQMVMAYTIESEKANFVAYDMAAVGVDAPKAHFTTGETVRFQEAKRGLVLLDAKGKKRRLGIQKKTDKP